MFIIAKIYEGGATPTRGASEYWGSTCIVFIIAKIYEVGATPTRGASEYWGSPRIVFIIAKIYEVGATPTRGASEYWGSTCIVFIIAKIYEAGATQLQVRRNIGVRRTSCLLSLKSMKWVRPNYRCVRILGFGAHRIYYR